MSQNYLEAYACSVNSGRLDGRDEDLILAAGMCRNKLGIALGRVVGEFDGRALTRSALAEAQRHAHILALRHDIDLGVADSVLAWFISPNCEACEGRGYLKIPGTPKLSDNPCPCCHGEGHAPIPGGQDGLRFARWLEEFAARAGASIKRRIHPGSPS